MEKRIHDKNCFYTLLRIYVDGLFRLSYRRMEYHGKEKIPQNAAIIYAPNHTNTLMDALAVLAIDKKPKVFVARADVFKNPVANKILTFLKMLPINRMRDGSNNLTKNEEINHKVVEALRDKTPFCILPEGRHRAKHSLLPLQKGIFRIALQANDNFGKEIPVYIVPIGIEFGHFFRHRSSILLQVGNPINVSDFVLQNSQHGCAELINALRDELNVRMKEVILQIEDNSDYEGVLELTHIFDHKQRQQLNLKKNTLINRFLSAKATITETENLLKENSSAMRETVHAAADFSSKRHQAKIGAESYLKKYPVWSIVGRFFLLVLGLPYFVFFAVITSPITLISIWACSLFKDKAFCNTLRYMITLLLFPFLFLIIGLVAWINFGLWWAIVAIVLFLLSFHFLYEYLRTIRLFVSDIRWTLHKKLQKQLAKLQKASSS